MMNHERRLTRLEAQRDVDTDCVAWADVHAAMMRQQARARLAIGQHLDLDPGNPCLVDALMWLSGDNPARIAQDVEITARWQRQHGIRADTGDVRQRFTERLDAMTRRLQACPSALPPAHG
jgi:predicted glycoside hydrolase/deacetylase ChbG (UPF0249 family)